MLSCLVYLDQSLMVKNISYFHSISINLLYLQYLIHYLLFEIILMNFFVMLVDDLQIYYDFKINIFLKLINFLDY